MLVQTVMSLAAPWPLKIVIDTVVGNHRQPEWINWLLAMLGGKARHRRAAGIATVVIAVTAGAAMYVGQLLHREFESEHRKRPARAALQPSATAVVGLLRHRPGGHHPQSTLTSDVQTIQSFASTATLNIFTNSLTVVGMVVVMFLCRWDFTLIAMAVTPLLAVFVLRVNKAVRNAVKEVRTHQSDLLAILQEGLQSIQVVQAFGREDHQEQQAARRQA